MYMWYSVELKCFAYCKRSSDDNFISYRITVIYRVESNGEVRYNRKVAKYIPYSKTSEENVRFVQMELYKLYQGYDNCVAGGIAIENGNIVYIVDSG